MKKVLLDASFVIEVLLGRSKMKECIGILELNYIFCINLLTVHLLFYFGIKSGLRIDEIYDFVKEFKILGLSEEDYLLAINLILDNDLEDALQVANALNSNCDQVISLDSGLKKYNECFDVKIV